MREPDETPDRALARYFRETGADRPTERDRRIAELERRRIRPLDPWRVAPPIGLAVVGIGLLAYAVARAVGWLP